jgi:YD repeat-containing protein
LLDHSSQGIIDQIDAIGARRIAEVWIPSVGIQIVRQHVAIAVVENESTTYADPGHPPTKETALVFNNLLSGSDAILKLDGLGRLAVSQVRTAPGSTSFDNTVSYGYGWNSTGRVTTQTIPGGTALTTMQYDALGRNASVTDGGSGVLSMTYAQNDVLRSVGPAPTGENGKQKQTEYDVLGRITSVCEMTSTLLGNGTCTQASSTPKGYFTTYSYDNPVNSVVVTQNATGTAQQRTYQYDGLGRLTSEMNPETGASAITYVYDIDSTCGTSTGDLVRKVDAGNNVTCYAHDALHRVTGITYPSGPNAASTPSKTFVYDATTFSCTNPNGAFVKGRLAEAFTGPISAKITDIAYCYSPRGETTDAFESTAHSGSTPYHTVASYWENGALKTLSGVPSRNAWTFGVDGEGRPYSAVDGSTTNLVTATTYNAASQPTGVSLGSGDSDAYTYDPNTGRMATYQYKVGATPKYVTGTLGWNPNWSLGSLVIADAFNAADAQTCAYSHDDLSRLQSVSCGPTSPNGTTWGQTFSYDPFGNISKTGTSSFLPIYTGATGTGTTPTNQYYQIPGGPAGASNYYDLSGNLTSDLTNTYAWDSDRNTVGINLGGSAPINLTYDALDRVVEMNKSGAYSQVLYSPIGKLALMTKQTTNNVFLPLPGGEQATYTGSVSLSPL